MSKVIDGDKGDRGVRAMSYLHVSVNSPSGHKKTEHVFETLYYDMIWYGTIW